MEKDLDINSGAYDFGARVYDGRLAKWLSVDALANKYSDLSPYCFVGNNPIHNREVDGNYFAGTDGKKVTYEIKDGKLVLSQNANLNLQRLADMINKKGLTLIKRVGDSYIEQEAVYFTQFKKIADNQTKVHFDIKKRKGNLFGIHLAHDKKGQIPWKGDDFGTYSRTPETIQTPQDVEFKEATITMYEDKIRKDMYYTTVGSNIRLSQDKELAFTESFLIIFSHEAEHDLDKKSIQVMVERASKVNLHEDHNIEDQARGVQQKAAEQMNNDREAKAFKTRIEKETRK